MALAADPTLAEAAYNLGSLHDDLGDPPQATLWYRRALEIRPDYADAHFNLASALERAGDGTAARRHWARYLELDPDSRWAEIARELGERRGAVSGAEGPRGRGRGPRARARLEARPEPAARRALRGARATPASRALAECVPVRADDVAAIVALAERERIDLTVVGPERPLALGLADALEARGRPVFGPSRAAAALESSKVFAKALFARHGIPTARFGTFDDAGAARAFVDELGGRAVVKADGLAAGKGAVVCADPAEADRAIGDMLERRVFGDAGARVVVEELPRGRGGLGLRPDRRADGLPARRRPRTTRPVFDGDRGPNTGGMGAYSPGPGARPRPRRGEIRRTVLEPTDPRPCRPRAARTAACSSRASCSRPAGPRVLEYNVRFGDPECQALMLRLADDLLPLCQAVAEGRGLPPSVAWRPEAAVCVVLASGGYPGEYATGLPDRGDRAAPRPCPGVTVFHAGTATARRPARRPPAGGSSA